MEQRTGLLPTFSVENITPELAAHYLTFNTANRPAKKTKIAQYARDMSAGKWLMTAEPIKFSPDGILRDGQNRLRAVIQAQTTVTMVVARNVPAESMVVMDAGSPRSRSDALLLSGCANGKDVAATVVVHYFWVNGFFPTAMSNPGGEHRPSNISTVEYVAQHPGLVEAVQHVTSARRTLRLPIGSLAVAYDAFVKIDPDDTLDFFSRIRELRTSGAGDPVATLIKRVQADSAARRRILASTGLFYLFRTWNALRDGEPLLKFQVGSAMGGWIAIPEPK